ncbi:MAG: hypothetical protein Q8L27_04425 [archaeon]|nr:hypothetical protein [archaeon]
MANEPLYGMLKEGFYIIKPLHCNKAQNGVTIGACRAGFAGLGYLHVDSATIETVDGFHIRIMQKSKAKVDDLTPSDLEYIANPESYKNTYLARANFIETRIKS